MILFENYKDILFKFFHFCYKCLNIENTRILYILKYIPFIITAVIDKLFPVFLAVFNHIKKKYIFLKLKLYLKIISTKMFVICIYYS